MQLRLHGGGWVGGCGSMHGYLKTGPKACRSPCTPARHEHTCGQPPYRSQYVSLTEMALPVDIVPTACQCRSRHCRAVPRRSSRSPRRRAIVDRSRPQPSRSLHPSGTRTDVFCLDTHVSGAKSIPFPAVNPWSSAAGTSMSAPRSTLSTASVGTCSQSTLKMPLSIFLPLFPAGCAADAGALARCGTVLRGMLRVPNPRKTLALWSKCCQVRPNLSKLRQVGRM